MTQYSPRQIIALVLKYHPTTGDDHMLNCLAICLAESGGNTRAISPASDYGLWQINRIHFGDGVISASNWSIDSVQVAEMWKLSSGMQNWAAWCTAWANPGPNCGHGNLGAIQQGSAAWGHYEVAIQAIRAYRGTPPPGQAPPALSPEQQDEKAVSAAFNYARKYYSSTAHAQLVALQAAEKAIVRLRP